MEKISPDLLASVQTASEQVAATLDYRGMALVLYCGLAYALGVATSIVLAQTRAVPADAPPRWLLVLARLFVSGMMFPLTYPAQAYVVNNPIAGSRLVPLDWLKGLWAGSDLLGLQIFAFGLVMLLGVVSYEVFDRVRIYAIGLFTGMFGPK